MSAQLTDQALAKLNALAGMHHGEGVNNYLLTVFNHMRHEVPSPEEAKSIARPYLAQARPEKSEYELEVELNRQAGTAYDNFVPGLPAIKYERKPAWPTINHEAIKRIAASGFGVYDLWEQSPVRFDDGKAHTEEIIDGLFADDEYIAVSENGKFGPVEKRRKLRGKLSKCSHIVPAVMRMEGGYKRDGRHSFKCNDAVKTKPFIVFESDQLTKDEQAAILHHLSDFLPLVLVVDSAGDSLHGWFYRKGLTSADKQLSDFMNYARKLGADFMTYTLSQYVRMPGGLRRPGNKRQPVIYWNGGVR